MKTAPNTCGAVWHDSRGTCQPCTLQPGHVGVCNNGDTAMTLAAINKREAKILAKLWKESAQMLMVVSRYDPNRDLRLFERRQAIEECAKALGFHIEFMDEVRQ